MKTIESQRKPMKINSIQIYFSKPSPATTTENFRMILDANSLNPTLCYVFPRGIPNTLICYAGPNDTRETFLGKINARNGLSRTNRSTLKKSFPKSIKKSSRNRFQKLDPSHFIVSGKKTTKFFEKHKNSSNLLLKSQYKKSRVSKNTTCFQTR